MSLFNRNNRIIFPAVVLDNNDPLRLGRIRAHVTTQNRTELESIPHVPWGENDPFLVLPLLPYFLNVTPQDENYVHVLFTDPDYDKNKDKFYISGIYSSPTTVPDEGYDSAQTHLESGSQRLSYRDIIVNGGEEERYKGVYANPDDIAIYGKGTADVIIKGNELLLRAGKNVNHGAREIPNRYDQRSFIQLTKYDSQTLYLDPSKYFEFQKQTTRVRILVEYNLDNPENSQNLFTGSILIYSLKPDEEVSTDNLNVSSDVSSLKFLRNRININQTVSLDDYCNIINLVLTRIKQGDLSLLEVNTRYPGLTVSGERTFREDEKFPFYYRPSSLLRKIIYEKNLTSSSFSAQEIENMETLKTLVKNPVDSKNEFYGLVYDEKNKNVPFEILETTVFPKEVVSSNKTVNIQGSDQIYLLSHLSQIPGKTKVDLSNTLYGVSESLLADQIEPNTSSVVRGEELLELLQLIVEFLISHVHPFPGVPPVPVSSTGRSVDELLKELYDASDKILNKNIRIN